VIQRWLGLANVEIQTASGSTGAELVIEGFKNYEAIRDFLYTRMRGYVSQQHGAREQAPIENTMIEQPAPGSANEDGNDEMIKLLIGIRDELRRTRELIETQRRSPAPPHV
jgi:putative membrane protein